MKDKTLQERIIEKIEFIEKSLSELYQIFPDDYGEYIENFGARAASERYAEKIIEALVDISYLTNKLKQLDFPETDLHSFRILENKNIITIELSNNLQDAKKMRNIIVHQYGEINDEIVFNAIKNKLQKDSEDFINIIKNII